MRFGVNYTPTRGWFHHWLDFDLAEIREDLDSVAALGLDHIRVFPLWPLFQPNRGLIRPRAVEQLVALTDAAAERGLDVAVDGLQGHLSSFDFLPAWTTTWHRGNLFTDPEVVEAQAAYLRTLAAALHARPNFLGMTLGNEINQFSDDPHPDPHRASAAQIDAWLRRMLAACEQGAPGRAHLHAEDDATWYRRGHPFTPDQAATLGVMTAVHSWVFNGTAQRHGPTGTATEQHAAYLIELSKAWATDPARPVWLQEVGAPSPHIPPERAAAFTAATVEAALDCAHLWGVTWWCSHDVDRALADFPELEYGLGLLTHSRQPKPAGRELARIAAERRAGASRPAPRTTALVLDPDEPGTAAPDHQGAGPGPGRTQCAPGGTFFEAWAALAADGVRPAAVLASRAAEPAHLAARGITETVHPSEVPLGGVPPPARRTSQEERPHA
ncbi:MULTISPECIES: glycosyl hydrolase [unclassified Streptomyces]|uniref:glycoside hydrolase 5 family protein n=1 Tax=unclassified Streptomyces TaxID=2593676 RepID=UPI002DDA8630|nr:glycosyl hydrolase [Streptomyces sp. NBC_01795]WSA90934.1 glycosyl hydrolase [Streptomyces sp. NBC_01795]WSS45277.1 glycosyl hydrolase [Streptomyces sp. NBC_01187]